MEIIVRDYRLEDLTALIDLFRGSVRLVARRDYSERQVLAWAPDIIDSEGFALRCIAKPTWVRGNQWADSPGSPILNLMATSICSMFM